MKSCTALLLVSAALACSSAVSQADDPIFARDVGLKQGRPELAGAASAHLLADEIDLSAEQRWKISLIFTQEYADLNALGYMDTPAAVVRIRQAAANQVRALLTPGQRAQFNVIRPIDGGGLVGKAPTVEVARLDKLVHLNPGQKAAALDIYTAAAENLGESQTPAQVGHVRKIRVATQEYIRALLSPEQQAIWDATPQKQGGGQMTLSAERQVAKVDALVHLTAAEKAAALRIYRESITALMNFPVTERPLHLPELRQLADTKIRALLTPEQQRIWDTSDHAVRKPASVVLS